MLEVLDEQVVRRRGVINDKGELVHQAAIGDGDEVAAKPRLFVVAQTAVYRILVFQVGTHTVKECQKAVMREAAFAIRQSAD